VCPTTPSPWDYSKKCVNNSVTPKKIKQIKALSKGLILQAAMRKYVKLLGKDATYEINEEVIESE